METKDEIVYTKSIFMSNSLCERFSKNYFAINPDFETSLPFVNDMLNNHRKCPYWIHLKNLCPSILDIKKDVSCAHRKSVWRFSTKELLENCVLVHNVHRYLHKIFKKVVCLQVLGNKYNSNCFMKHIKKLLSVHMHGQISLDHMVDGIKTKSIVWLQSYSQKDKGRLLKQTVHFLITRFIGPLIQSFFYVTQSTTSKNKLFFYRKKTWYRLSQIASSKFILSCKLKKVSENWVQTKLKESKCLGVSSVRFLVKSTSLRPIVNLAFRNENKASVNQHLKTLLLVLTFERKNNPEVFGATIMDVEDMHSKWSQFVTHCKQNSEHKLYFVKVDIEKCYDTINPCLLYSIISNIINKSSYKIYKYKKLYHKNGVVKSSYFESCQHPNILCSSMKAPIETCGSYVVTKDVLLGKLWAHLFCNVSKVGRQYYVQTLGISQGSVLSSILCGAYYGYMEQTILNRVIVKSSLLVRLVDDMMYVTSCQRSAHSFLVMNLEGIPEFNCRCNLNKCFINFNYHHAVYGDVPSVSNKSPITFCGLAFDTETLNVHLDFSNYRNVHTCDTLSFNLTKHPGSMFKKKMLSLIYPKCLSMLFDKDINCEDSIHYNILCIFAVCAVKFHCLVMYFPPKRRALNNPRFFTDIIVGLPQAMIAYSTQKLRKFTSHKHFPITKEVVTRLCFQTFLFKLRMHYNMYAPVIDHLEHRKSCSQQDERLSDKLPQVFKNIHIK